MPITAITGKQCTITIDATPYTAWLTTLSTASSKSSTTVATWGEDVAYRGTPDYSATGELVFDPNEGSLSEALEAAFADDDATIDLVVDLGGATRTYTAWQVSEYSDDAPADGLVTASFTITGSAMPTTVYVTPDA